MKPQKNRLKFEKNWTETREKVEFNQKKRTRIRFEKNRKRFD